ncbi:MAG: LptF/LptG family permease [Planctomycetota bacterium]
MLTLHLYYARELLKTFLMTAVALTLLIVMGGGVANLFRGQGIGADEMAKVFLFLTPVAVTLILPVAALFSAAITYGRSAADNEVLACRGAGINIHKLFVPALVLGLLVTIFTYWSWNYMIPSLSRQIEEMSRRDLPSIVMGQFQKAKPLAFGKYRMTTSQCRVIESEDLDVDLPPNHTYLELIGVSFLETADQDVIRFGTADTTIIDFDRTVSVPRVTVDLQGVRNFDVSRRQYYEMEHQVLGPFEIPMPIRRKTKFENLNTLLEYARKPETIPDIEGRLHGLEREMMTFFAQTDAQESFDPDLGGDGTYRLVDKDVKYDISAEGFNVDPDNGRIALRNVRVVETAQPHGRILTADAATIELRSGVARERPVIIVELAGNVGICRDTPESQGRVVHKPKESLKPVEFFRQPSLAKKVEEFDPLTLLDPTVTFKLHRKHKVLRDRLLERLGEKTAEIQGEIHFRASYTMCAVAIVLFGAVLGVIIRGGQVLTAFGVSCVPMVFVVVASIVGRNLAERPDYALLSVIIMWSSTLFMYCATAFVAMRVLKR